MNHPTSSPDLLAPPNLTPSGAARIAQAIAVEIRNSHREGLAYPPELDAYRAYFAGVAMGRAVRSGQERPTSGQTSTADGDQAHDGPTLLTYEQAGHLMGVSPRTVRRLADDGELPRRRIGSRAVRIHRDDIRDYLDAQTSEGPR